MKCGDPKTVVTCLAPVARRSRITSERVTLVAAQRAYNDNFRSVKRLQDSEVTSLWDDPGDRRLLARMADGEREALAELYDRHANALFGHALALGRSPEDAEDLMQGVFVKVAAMGPRLLGIRSAGAYMHRMLRASFVDHERHRAIAGEEPLALADRAMTIGVAEADRLAVDRALGTLPVEQREVIILHVVEGLTFREAAAAIGAPMWTVASRYRLGISRLRRVLGKGK
jgi:RNA polymerase sigma-70 factor (ECF subfamily)